MASVKLKLYKGKKLSDGSHPIVIQIIHNQRRKILSTGYHALPEQWDEKKNEPNRNYPNVTRLKNLLRTKLAEAEKEIIDLDAEGAAYTIEDAIDKIGGKTQNLNLTDYIEQIVNRMVHEGRVGNSKAYSSTQAILKLYHGESKRTLKDVNYKYVKNFESFLLNRGIKGNTIAFYMRTLRSVYNMAVKEGLIKKSVYPFQEYKIQREPTQKIAISKEDIHKIRDLELPEGSTQAFMRDIFMFSFYNRGMSLIDIVHLKVKDIRDGRIFYTRRKTGQQFNLKLLEPAIAIINRYQTGEKPEDFIFPIIQSNENPYLEYQNFKRLINRKLKSIAVDAKVNANLTTYVARHSWATIAKRSGIATAIISEGLGHETEQTTQIYLDSFENDVLDKANELITG